ncbi:MAG: phosphodiester glycosidase family protein [Armatimonadota bacterium]
MTVDLQGSGVQAPEGSAIVRDGRLLVATDYVQQHLGYECTEDDDGVNLQIYGHSWRFREGEETCTFDGERRTLPVAAQTHDGRFYCPAQILLEPVGITVYSMGSGCFGLEFPRAHVTQIRRGTHSEYVRMVIDLSGPVPFSYAQRGGRFHLRVPLDDDPDAPRNLLRQLHYESSLVPVVTESHQNGQAQISITHHSPHEPEVFTLPDPPRIVVDFMRAAPLPIPEPGVEHVTPQPPGPKPLPEPKRIEGVTWRSCTFSTARGPVRGWMLKTDPADADISVEVALAKEGIWGAATVQSMVKNRGAYAGVNGGFYGSRGQPLGLLVLDGEWVTAPLHQRAVFGITRDGSVQIRNVRFDGRVHFEDLGQLPLEGINVGHRSSDGVVLYTPRWGKPLEGNHRKTRLVVSGGVVQKIHSNSEKTEIPEDGFVLSGLDRRAESLTRVHQGQGVRLDLKCDPQWPEMVSAVGAGPRLLVDGKEALSMYDERFRSDITRGTRPRTAAGVDKDGHLVLLVAEDTKGGLTLSELASVMKKFGCVDAMNLDGGGSSTFVIDGQLMNVVSDGWQRPVGNAIVIIDERAQ